MIEAEAFCAICARSNKETEGDPGCLPGLVMAGWKDPLNPAPSLICCRCTKEAVAQWATAAREMGEKLGVALGETGDEPA